MEVGFIGLGLMGRPMALNLIKAGHRVHVWSRRRASMEPLLAAGAGDCESAADVARRAAVTISMVADAPDVEQVTLGPAGVAEAAGAGHIHIDMSTIAPAAAQSIAARLAARGVTALDAPVSGGEVGAIAGSLTIMAGGDADAFARVLPLLEAMGRSITRIGDAGAGQVAKACNQIIQVINIQGIAEAMLYAARMGADPGRVIDAISAGMAGSKMLDLMGPKMAVRDFQAGIEARLHAKDIAMVAAAAQELGMDMPATAVADRQLERLLALGWGREDTSSLLRVLEAHASGGANLAA